MTCNQTENRESIKTLPGDDVRQVMWRYNERYDLQMLVQATRGVARSVVARLVANGERHHHEWTPAKQEMLEAFDAAGVTAAYMDPEDGGFIEGPKNMALALAAFELAWVDGGSATCSLAGNLGLAPIAERGTPEQRKYYMSNCVPPQPGDDRKQLRAAFALTEPLPYVGVDTGVLCGKVKVSEWKDGEEPVLEVMKRGRFITNMDFANVVTAAVESDDPRIKGSCMVILREDDEGSFDRGAPTMKMVHQLSSTRDPIITVKVPADRIIGGYEIKDGVIVPNYSHGEVIEAVFRRTRVTVALMTSAKLLSAVEPIIRYQRGRFRGGSAEGTPRFNLGLQMKEDALQRLADVWAAGEASASLGFAAANLLDNFDPIDRWREEYFIEQGLQGPRAQMKVFKEARPRALEFIKLAGEGKTEDPRYKELLEDKLVQFMIGDAVSNVLCPACKLWNTGYGAQMMREAVSLMGGYGITEDCPGFLMHKWTDAQLEATYEGPEAVQRRHMSSTITNELFIAQFEEWTKEMKRIAKEKPESGAKTVAAAMDLWLFAIKYLTTAKDANGKAIFHSQRQGVTFAASDALCWILAARYQILDVLELEKAGTADIGTINFLEDLTAVHAIKTAGSVSGILTSLVYGFVDDAAKQKEFADLKAALDKSLIGLGLVKDRAANALTEIMIPEALDYPMA